MMMLFIKNCQNCYKVLGKYFGVASEEGYNSFEICLNIRRQSSSFYLIFLSFFVLNITFLLF